MEILAEKKYPNEYPAEAVKVLNAMTFTDKASGLKVVGSSSLRSQLYAGDYDGYETVEGFSLDGLVKRFKEIIRDVKKVGYIGDIKSGEIEEWRVIPLQKKKFSKAKAQDKIESLLKDSIISSEEAKEAEATLDSYLIAKQEVKFQVVRWTPEEVLKGHKTLRDGRKYTLQEAFSSPALTKLDVIAKVKGVYTEFSVIYEFVVDGKVINKVPLEPKDSLKESIAYYKEVDNPYKVLKRKFALAKLQDKPKEIRRLSKLINSDLGKLYRLYSDVKTFADLLEEEKVPTADFKSNIRIITEEGLPEALKGDLAKVKSQADLPILRHIEDALYNHLSKDTKLSGGFAYQPFNE